MLCQNPDCQRQIDDDSKFCVFCTAGQITIPETAIIQCQHPKCQRKIDDDSTFCVHCGTTQSTEEATVIRPVAPAPVGRAPDRPSSQQYRFIEFRASENIWNFTETEPYLAPEQRRPVLILDEQTILLDETSKHLEYDDLLARVQQIIREKQVPVEAYIVHARWINDQYEIRPRIIAELKDHTYSGLKMVLALDYMGSWALLQFQIGMQPDVIPKPPPAIPGPSQIPQLLMVFGALGAIFGLLIAFGGITASSGGVTLFGIVLLLGGGGLFWAGLQQFNQMNHDIDLQKKERDTYEREQYQRALYKAKMELFRTFKIDDAFLFREAMDKIFKQVVDDIVEQGGGKIVKEIKGGDESMFGFQPPVPTTNVQGIIGSNQSATGKVVTVASAVAKHKVKSELGLDI